MPELPEVEVLRRGLEPHLLGQTLAKVTLREPKVLLTPAHEFAQQLTGGTFTATSRRGKYLLLTAGPVTLIVHLRMTGQLTWHDPSQPDSPGFMRQPVTGLQQARQHPLDRHTHLVFTFAHGRALYYRDTRKFGRLQVWPTAKLDQHPALSALGPEPLGPGFTLNVLRNKLSFSRRAIKPCLLDQHQVAGLGNIYVDEALFQARIHPLRPADSLTPAEQKRLFQAIPWVLRKGIEFGGTTLRDYVQSDGRQGSNQDELLVYGCQGKPCPRCETTLIKLTVAQRGTHLCPKCQPLKGSTR